jgi:hypothetical protein
VKGEKMINDNYTRKLLQRGGGQAAAGGDREQEVIFKHAVARMRLEEKL